MVIWGGASRKSSFADGASYDPVLDRWTALPASGAPTSRWTHTASWTGQAMVVWGGTHEDGAEVGFLASGAAFDVHSGAWRAIAAAGAPSPRNGHVAVTAGPQVVVWGGAGVPGGCSGVDIYCGDGAVYDLRSDSWAAMDPSGAPSPRAAHSGVWTGRDLIVWGGQTEFLILADGGRWTP